MEQPRIVVLCGGAFAFQSIMILHMEKYLAGIGIGSQDMQVQGMLASECERIEIPFLPMYDKGDVSLLEAWLNTVKPDYIFCICFPYRISDSLLQQYPERFFNFHTGPLPTYRGPMPIFEVIRRSEQTSAIAVHLMDAGFDTGALVFEEPVALDGGETFISLTVKLSERSGIAAMNLAQMLEFGSRLPQTKQDESLANFYSFPKTIDLTLNWANFSAVQCIALIHACMGWSKGAITTKNGEMLRIVTVSAEPYASGYSEHAGTIISQTPQGGVEIVCGDGWSIEALSFQTDYENYTGIAPEQIGLVAGVFLGS
jgi:methionyl-tRNA formyltransferase